MKTTYIVYLIAGALIISISTMTIIIIKFLTNF